MPSDVVFEVPQNFLDDFLREAADYPELQPEVQQTVAATGGGDMVTVLVALGSTTIGSLTTLATVWIKRGATVEVGGQKVTGISRPVADQLARKLVDAHTANRTDRGETNGASPYPGKPSRNPAK